MSKKRICLAMYSDPKIYPPTVHAANILAEQGWMVYLVGISYPNSPDNILIDQRIKQVYRGTHARGIKNLLSYISFSFYLLWLAVSNKVNVFIAYDSFAVLPVYIPAVLTAKKWIYHQHDYFEFPQSYFQKLVLRSEQKLAKKAFLVVFPQMQRAEIFAAKAKLSKPPLIVFNGPRKTWADDIQPINEQIIKLRSQFGSLMVYQGGWSKYFGIENLINAVKYCHSDIAVVIMGKELEEGIRSYYEQLCAVNNVSERFFFLEHVPYDRLPSVTKYCDAGIGKLTKDKDDAPLNDRFVIGASNKITEYVAFGLPVITCISEPNRIFFNDYPVGVMCDVAAHHNFAGCIDNILADKARLLKIKEENKIIFLEKLNYDTQFSKVHTALEALYEKG